jgi:hypothetical protein
MKGKRHTPEQEICILLGAGGGRSIVEVCKEHNISRSHSTVGSGSSGNST